MKKTFKAYPEIEIPAFLHGENWQDDSWGNDAAPRMTRIFDANCPYELTVWVQHPNPAKREMQDAPRFSVVVYDRETGDELDGTEAKTARAAEDAVKYWEALILFLEDNRKGDNPDQNIIRRPPV